MYLTVIKFIYILYTYSIYIYIYVFKDDHSIYITHFHVYFCVNVLNIQIVLNTGVLGRMK